METHGFFKEHEGAHGKYMRHEGGRMGKGNCRQLACLPVAILFATGHAWSLQASRTQSPPPKSSVNVSAHIPKEQLERETELKKLMDAGQEAFHQGKYEQAISLYQQALDFTKRLDPKEEGQILVMTTSHALADLGNSYLGLHQYSKAKTTFASLLEFGQKNLPFDSSVAGAFEDLAVVDGAQGNWPAAEDYLRRGIAYVEECVNHFKRSDTYNPQDIVANGDRRLEMRMLTEIGNVYANQSDFDAALSAYEVAFQIGDRFKADPESQRRVIDSAVRIAQLSRRNDQLNSWVNRSKALLAKID